MNVLLRVLRDEEQTVVARWQAAWPAASSDAAREMLRRARAALAGNESEVSAPPALSIGALSALRRAVLDIARGENVSVDAVIAFDDVFTAAIAAAASPEGVAVLEEEVTRIQRQLLSLVAQVPLAVALVEAPSGRTVIANERNNAIFRGVHPAAREGFDGYGALAGFTDDGRPLAPHEWPLVRAIHHGETVQGEVIRIRRGDGSAGYIRVSAAPIRGDDGEINGGAVIYDDVTEERQTAEGLRFLAEAGALLGSSLDYQETLKTLARLAVPRLGDWCSVEMRGEDGLAEQLAVGHVDPEKVALALEHRRKYPPDPEVKTVGLYRVFSTGESELFAEITDEMLEAGIKDKEQLALTRALGLRSGLVVAIKANGKVLGALSLVASEGGRRYTHTDVLLAEQIAARAGLAIENALLYRQAQDAVKMREDFLSIASHELRTPLTALHLQITTLQRKAKSGQPLVLTAEKLDRLDAQLRRLRSLVDQLLDVSRLASGRIAYDVEAADLKDVVAGVVDELQDVAAQNGTPLRLSASGDTRGRWDRGRLEQVLTNVIGNAIKYGAGNDVDVAVSADAGGVAVAVTDRGVGISAEDQRRIFGRFERAATAKNFSGIGLGLWISQQIVAGHGGAISVDSAVGRGSTFTIRLPRESAPARGDTP